MSTQPLVGPPQVTDRLIQGVEVVPISPLFAEGAVELDGQSKGRTFPPSLILDDIHTVWDPTKFNTVRQPVLIGNVPSLQPVRVDAPIRATALPLKFPGTNYRIPAPLGWLTDLVQLVADTEAQINPHIDEYYAYLNLDVQYVTPGVPHRALGCHSDAVQGPSRNAPDIIDHLYGSVSTNPTAYLVQAFDLSSTPPSTHFLNPVFDRLADWDNAVCFAPCDVILIDAYCVHSAIVPQVEGWRVFVGVSFSTRKYDRVGNSHNPCFDYDWELFTYPLPSHLIGAPTSS